MDKEVDPQVLAVINEMRLSGPPQTPVEVIAKMGVLDARQKAYEYAWVAAGDSVIATIWAEYLSIGSEGRWFCLESLDVQFRPDGGERSPQQIQRGKSRVALLKKAFDAGEGFRGVLQTNRVSISELESNKSAKVSTRVRDDAEWHVASWESDRQLAVLVRGPRGWVPDAAALQAARARGGVPLESASSAASPEAVREAALGYVMRHFGGYGYKAENVTGRGLGYDVEVSNAKGATLLRVAVKGTSPGLPDIRLTSDESACAVREDLWRLLVVTDALSRAAQHKIYKPSEMSQAPGFQAAA